MIHLKRISSVLLSALVLFSFTPTPAFAAWKYIAGAELNTVTDGVEVTTNSTPIATSSTAHSGNYSWEVLNGAGFQRDVIYTANQSSVGWLRVWVYIKAYPNASTQFLRFSNATNVSEGNITMTTTGTLTLLKVSGAQVGSASAAIPLNTWTCVELKDDSSGVGALDGKVNGVSFASGANSAAGTWSRVLWGNITGVQTSNDLLFDDVVVTDSTTGDPGCGSDIFMNPNAAGDSSSWAIGGSTAAGTNWQSVNELPPDDGVTLVSSNSSNATDLYNFTDSGLHSYDTINALVGAVRYNNVTSADASTAFKLQYETSASGNKFSTAAIAPNSLTWSSYGVQLAKADSDNFATTTGATGAALTSSDLDNGQFGYVLSTASIRAVQVTSLWEYVDYLAGTAPNVQPKFSISSTVNINTTFAIN